MRKAITFHPMRAGINNQKLALLGLLGIAKSKGYDIAAPEIVDFAPIADRMNRRKFADVFSLPKLLLFADAHEINARTDATDVLDPWECFRAGAAIVEAYGKDRDFSKDDFSIDFFRNLSLSDELNSIVEEAINKSKVFEISLACQLRIESDWVTYCERMLSKRITRPEDYRLSYLDIFTKILKTQKFSKLRSAYVTLDENLSPISVQEIAQKLKADLHISIYSKKDCISNVERIKSPLVSSILDFEVAICQPCFVGLSRSTFSNLIAFTRFCRQEPNLVGERDFIYNAPVDFVCLRIDYGTRVDPIEVCADGDVAAFSWSRQNLRADG